MTKYLEQLMTLKTNMTWTTLTVLFCTFGTIAASELNTLGQEQDWYPSQWGAADQKGAANRLNQEKVLQAKNLIQNGKIYQLGHLYEAGMPLFGDRHYSLRIPFPAQPLGKNQVTYNEEIFSGELGQVGTQFDGLGHIGIGDLYYNGNSRREFGSAEGLTKLGVENAGVFVSRGVLLDVAGYKGVTMLGDTYEITAEDINGTLQHQNIEIHPGDVVLIHTGWGSLWMNDNDRYTRSEPGIGLEAAKFLAGQEIVMVGADNWSTEVIPNPDESLAFPVHQLLLAKNGIYNLENLITEDLARDKVYEFAFMFAPLRLKGATGSPGNPIAIH